jgi:hypothetical protein
MRFHEIDLSKRIESGDVALVCGDASPYVEKVTANPAITLLASKCGGAVTPAMQSAQPLTLTYRPRQIPASHLSYDE